MAVLFFGKFCSSAGKGGGGGLYPGTEVYCFWFTGGGWGGAHKCQVTVSFSITLLLQSVDI